MCDDSRHLVVGRISGNSSNGHAETIRVLSVNHLLRFASGVFGALIPRLGYFQENDPVFRCGFFSEAAAVLRKLAILFGALHDTSPCPMGPHVPNRNWRLTAKVPDQNLSSYGTYWPCRGSGPRFGDGFSGHRRPIQALPALRQRVSATRAIRANIARERPALTDGRDVAATG
jgi:hypothetical protein